MEDCYEEIIFIGSKKCLQVCNWWQMTVRPQSTIFKVATRRQGAGPKFLWAWWTWETQVVLGTANTSCNCANRGPTHLQGEPRRPARQVESTHRNLLLPCVFLAAETVCVCAPAIFKRGECLFILDSILREIANVTILKAIVKKRRTYLLLLFGLLLP